MEKIINIPIKKLSEASKLKMRNYYKTNREQLLITKKEKYKLNKDLYLSRNNEWRKNNKDKYLESKRKEYLKNKEKYSEYHKVYLNKKLKEDSYFKFKYLLRSRLRIAIKNKYKNGSAVKDLGCSGEEAYKYIESLFKEGMNWSNYGKWHIDHIKPLSSFDLENREQFLQAVNYKNLQPLWAIDNLKKNDRT